MSSFRANSSWSDSESIQRGALFAFVSKKLRAANGQEQLVARKDADLILEGPAGYGWFGQSSSVASIATTRLLFVGSPGHRDSLGNTTGCVHVYSLDGTNARLSLEISGVEPLAEFGHVVAVGRLGSNGKSSSGDAVLAIASPAAGASGTKLRAGEVSLVLVSDLAALLAGNQVKHLTLAELPLLALLIGDATYGRFGWELGFVDVAGDASQDLVVAAPLTNAGLLPGQRETGTVFVWDGARLPHGTITKVTDSAHWTATGQRSRGRFGSAFAQARGGQGLGIGSPRADMDGLEMAGCVDTFAVTFKHTGFVV